MIEMKRTEAEANNVRRREEKNERWACRAEGRKWVQQGFQSRSRSENTKNEERVSRIVGVMVGDGETQWWTSAEKKQSLSVQFRPCLARPGAWGELK